MLERNARCHRAKTFETRRRYRLSGDLTRIRSTTASGSERDLERVCFNRVK